MTPDLLPENEIFVSESGISLKETTDRLLQRMLLVTDIVVSQYREQPTLKHLEFLSGHIPRAVKLVQDIGNTSEASTEAVNLDDWSEDTNYQPVALDSMGVPLLSGNEVVG